MKNELRIACYEITKCLVVVLASYYLLLTSSHIVYGQTPSIPLRQEVEAVRESMKGKVVRLHKATVTNVESSILTVSSNGKTYTVSISSTTTFRRHYFGKSSLSEINKDDLVDVVGTYTDDTQTIIRARLIRDISIMKRRGVFFGIVASKSVNKITIDPKERGTQTITVSPTTKYNNQQNTSMTHADIQIGDLIRVRGMWDKANSTITEVVQIKDFSHKTTSSPTP